MRELFCGKHLDAQSCCMECECERLRSALKAAEARPCVEHCQEERAAGNGGCGACALCVGEWRHRAELAEHYNKVGDAIRERLEAVLREADAALGDCDDYVQLPALYLHGAKVPMHVRLSDARSTIARALGGKHE